MLRSLLEKFGLLKVREESISEIADRCYQDKMVTISEYLAQNSGENIKSKRLVMEYLLSLDADLKYDVSILNSEIDKIETMANLSDTWELIASNNLKPILGRLILKDNYYDPYDHPEYEHIARKTIGLVQLMESYHNNARSPIFISPHVRLSFNENGYIFVNMFIFP